MLGVFGTLFSQNRFVYRLDFKIDSLNREHVQSEMFNLDVETSGSIFYSSALAELDSIISNGTALGKDNMPEPKLDYVVNKDYKSGQISFQEMVGLMNYQTTEPKKIVWKIDKATQKYEGYKIQKATTDFAGRKWEAWFTKEIAINDGSYKFSGLPGLIVKLKDSRSDYDFYLVKTQKLDKPFTLESFKKLGIKSVKVEHDKFLKVKKMMRENPSLFFTQMGIELPADEMREFTEKMKQREKKQNNKIELK